MKHLTRIAATIVMLFAAPFVVAAPAIAGVPSNVHDGRHGTGGSSDIRLSCATSNDGARCALRIPGGARRVVIEHMVGRKLIGVERSYMDEEDHGASVLRSGRGQAAGVTFHCAGRSAIRCLINYPARVRDINTTIYVNQWNYGGLRAKNIRFF